MRVGTELYGSVSAQVSNGRFSLEGDRARVVVIGRVGGHDSPEIHLAFSVQCSTGTQTPTGTRVVWWTPIAKIYEEAVFRSGEVEVLSCDANRLVLRGVWQLDPGPLTAQAPDFFPAEEPGPRLQKLVLGTSTATPGPPNFVLDKFAGISSHESADAGCGSE